MAVSFRAVLDFESANTPPIFAGLNATARPNIELALRKPRRDLSSGSFIGCSFSNDFPGFSWCFFFWRWHQAQYEEPCRRTGRLRGRSLTSGDRDRTTEQPYKTAAIQSTSISNPPFQAGTIIKMLAV